VDEDSDILAAVLNFYRYGRLIYPSNIPSKLFLVAIKQLLLDKYLEIENEKQETTVDLYLSMLKYQERAAFITELAIRPGLRELPQYAAAHLRSKMEAYGLHLIKETDTERFFRISAVSKHIDFESYLKDEINGLKVKKLFRKTVAHDKRMLIEAKYNCLKQKSPG
jgi:hypothetical protein